MKLVSDEISDLKFKKFDLKNEFNKSIQNKEFRNFVSKFNLEDDTLMKYTSLLETSFNEYNNCANCKNLLECKNEITGCAYLPKVVSGKLVFEYKLCKYKKTIDKRNKYLNNVKYLNVSNNSSIASVDKINERLKGRVEVIEWLSNFRKDFLENSDQKGLYLSGNFGCGKSYLISATFNELAKSNVKSAIVFWPEFLRELKSSFDTDYNEKFEYIKKVPLLLIDDIGSETVTNWCRDEILCSLLQYRMDNHLCTFFTSNMDLDMLKDHLSQSNSGTDLLKSNRIIERIKQLTVYKEMQSRNMRE